jgi:hypothetical protein
MPVLKQRDRIVVFRLTQDEYDNLKTVCKIRGSRNITDFTRSEVLASIERELQEQGRSPGVSGIDQKLASLQSAIQHITKLLEGSLDLLAETGTRTKPYEIDRPDTLHRSRSRSKPPVVSS